jgi:hypothetical protein
MKTTILATALLAICFIAAPVSAVEEHHQGNETATSATKMNTGNLDTTVEKMQEMRQKIETAKNPETRKELMHQHMRMMKDGMNMMTMMDEKGGMMTEQEDPASMPMADRMAMMEKKMSMMEKMMGQGGGMMGGQGGMMGGGASGSPVNDRLDMMEKKMMMMQEMMTGMMMQQEVMMK